MGRFERLCENTDGLDEDDLQSLVVTLDAAQREADDVLLRLSVAWQWTPDPPEGLVGRFEVRCVGAAETRVELGVVCGPEVLDDDPRLDRATRSLAEVYVHTRPRDPDAAAIRLLRAHEAAAAELPSGLDLTASRTSDVLARGYGLLCETTCAALPRLRAALEAEGIDHAVLGGTRAASDLRLLSLGPDAHVVARAFRGRDLDAPPASPGSSAKTA